VCSLSRHPEKLSAEEAAEVVARIGITEAVNSGVSGLGSQLPRRCD